jgi:hypothetical protein
MLLPSDGSGNDHEDEGSRVGHEDLQLEQGEPLCFSDDDSVVIHLRDNPFYMLIISID